MNFSTFYKRSMIVAMKICAIYFLLAWLFSFIPSAWLYFYSVFIVLAWHGIVEGLWE